MFHKVFIHFCHTPWIPILQLVISWYSSGRLRFNSRFKHTKLFFKCLTGQLWREITRQNLSWNSLFMKMVFYVLKTIFGSKIYTDSLRGKQIKQWTHHILNGNTTTVPRWHHYSMARHFMTAVLCQADINTLKGSQQYDNFMITNRHHDTDIGSQSHRTRSLQQLFTGKYQISQNLIFKPSHFQFMKK